MFEIPVGARHLLIQETDATSHNLGKYVTRRKKISQNIFFLLFIFVSGASQCVYAFVYPLSSHITYLLRVCYIRKLVWQCDFPVLYSLES